MPLTVPIFRTFSKRVRSRAIRWIQLGYTGFVLGFEDAGFVFGGEGIPSVESPEELLDVDFPLNSLTDITLDSIREKLTVSVQDALPTFLNSFTFVGTGTLTNIYVQGLISGAVTVGATISPADPLNSLKFFAKGSIDVIGMPIAGASVVLDLADILAPQIDFAFGLPAPDNPLGFLFPIDTTVTAALDTSGIVQAPLVGLSVFVSQFLDGTLNIAAEELEFFGDVFDRIASDLEASRTSDLAVMFLDTDRNGTISPTEDQQTITREFMFDRVLGSDGQPAMLVVAYEQILNLTPDDLAYRTVFVVEFIERIRDEIKFSGISELSQQIARDVSRARNILT